jgi:hypothetical protein
MSNANNTWLGSSNSSSPADLDAERAIFLKMYAGEVVTAFEKHTVMLDKHKVRTITSGKSAQFPVIGRIPDAEYHTPGAEILGQDILHGERVVPIDRLLISHIFIDNLDEAMAHFEVRGEYSNMQGQKLAETFDAHVMREACLGAAASATVSTLDGGLVTTDDDFDSTTPANKWTAWEDAIFETAENFDNKFVPKERYLVIKPSYYNFLVRYVQTNGFSAINRDYNGQGSYADGSIFRIAGIDLIGTPMLPVGNYSTEDFHAVDNSKLRGLAFGQDSVATVKLLDLQLEAGWDMRRQGTLMIAKYAMGHAYLRPESCATMKDVT